MPRGPNFIQQALGSMAMIDEQGSYIKMMIKAMLVDESWIT